MAIEITWQAENLYVDHEHLQRSPLLTLPDPDQRRIVEHWAAQADSVPEFLEMLHLEGLLTLENLRQLLTAHAPLYRIWEQLRTFCGLTGDIGEYPAHRMIGGDPQDPLPDTAIRLPDAWVREAVEAWTRFEGGAPVALHSPSLGMVLSVLGFLGGQRLGLPWREAVVFGDWLSALITDCTMGHGNDAAVVRVDELAAALVYGTPHRMGRACVSPEVWTRYRPAIASVVRALQAGL